MKLNVKTINQDVTEMKENKKIYPSKRLKDAYLWLSDKPVLKRICLRVYARINSRGVNKNFRGKDNELICDKALLRNVVFDVEGDNNRIVLGDACLLRNVIFKVKGSNNQIIIGDEVRFNFSGSVCCEDSNGRIEIGNRTTFESVHLAAIEGTKIFIGVDCMISGAVDIRTGDSHSILDAKTGKRINSSRDIIIKNHVWVGNGVRVLKGVTVNEDSILGMGSIVTNDVSMGTIVAGIPARIVKSGITWNRIRVCNEG